MKETFADYVRNSLDRTRYGEGELQLRRPDLETIRAARQEAIRTLSSTPDGPSEHAVSLATARLLMQDNAFLPAAHVAAAADEAGDTILEIQSLARLGARDTAVARLKARSDRTDLSRKTRRAILRTKGKLRVPTSPADHLAFFDKLPGSLPEAIRALSPPFQRDFLPLARQVAALRGDATAEDLARRILWGREFDAYVEYLDLTARHTDADAPGAREVMDLAARLPQLFDISDLKPFLDKRQSDQSVILLCAHSGALRLTSLLRKRLKLRPAMISANGRTDLSEQAKRLVLGVKDATPDELARFTKIIRKQPRMVELMPDGRMGQDRKRLTVCGKPVEIGTSLTTLAWHSRALTMFCRAEWTGTGIRYRLTPGPVRDKGMSRDSFDAALYGLYRQGLEEIVLGTPETMTVQGGFWGPLLGKKPVRDDRSP